VRNNVDGSLPRRVAKLAAILKPATLVRFHKALVDRKYRRLLSYAETRREPDPKGPTEGIKSVPYAPMSHPFAERQIGTILLPTAPRPRIAPETPHLRKRTWLTMPGNGIAMGYSEHPSPLER